MALISVQNVSKNFGKKTVVKNISFEIEKGEVFGFLGPNGAGKTTTMKMILGLTLPTSGEIKIFDQKAGSINVRRRIGFLPEFSNFYQHLTGMEFLYFVGEIFEIPDDEIKRRSKKLVKLVNMPPNSPENRISTYSKGMQQRIGLAQALMNDPEILFLDEPMSGLDPIGRREMKNIILNLKKEGKVVFFNSHILSDAEEICDKIGIILNGKILSLGKTEEILTKKKSLEEFFIEIVSGKKSTRKVKIEKKSNKKIIKKTVKKTTKKKTVNSSKSQKKSSKTKK